jgi:RecA-family ATPase
MPMFATWQILDAATTARKRLREAGFLPIPAVGKAPPMLGWQKLVATDAEIDDWFRQYPKALNTSVLTRRSPAVDVDVLDSEVAASIEQAVWEMVGTRGMVRFGQPPKRAILFRAEVPFGKISTPVFTSPTQQRHRVEVLCDGQQIVVLGTHPGTGKPYSWHGGEPGDLALADLPELTEALARDFITKAAAIMREQGWIEEKVRKTNGAHHGANHGGDEFIAIYGTREEKYAAAALKGCCDELAAMPQHSGRNNKLNALAYRMGTMSARQWIARDKVGRRLYEVAAACLLVNDDGESAARATIESGLSSGELRSHPDLMAETQPQDNKAAALMPLPFVDISAWHVNEGVPAREWGVRDVFPRRNVALLSGEGAVGKTLLLLQLGVAHALGRDWIGTLPEPGPFAYLGAEDDVGELHRRLADILKHYGADFPDLQGNVHLLSFAGEDAVLGHADHTGLVRPTPLYERLMKAAMEIRPVLIGLDTSAPRTIAPRCASSSACCARWRSRRTPTSSSISHPSLTGINSGSGLSGSTGWHNSVRARAYLTTVKTDKDEEPDPNLRTLEFKKNNYGPIARSISLRWQNGVYVPVGNVSSVDKMAKEHTADRLFKALLDRFNSQGRNVSEKAASKNYAPTVFGKEPEAKKYSLKKVSKTPCGGCSRPARSLSSPMARRAVARPAW